MKKVTIALLCFVLAFCAGSCTTAPDPIDALVEELNEGMGFEWMNGLYPEINLPPDARLEEVLDQAVEVVGFDQGYIETYKIKEIRQVQLNSGATGETFSAALVQTNLGTKIFLCRAEGNNRWWTRFYDVP